MEPHHENDAPPSVSLERIENLAALWHAPGSTLQWTCPFVLPPWLNAWYEAFDFEVLPLLLVVRQGEIVIGIAPLMVQDRAVQFLGSPDVCDYFDWVVVHGREDFFLSTIITYLSVLNLGDLNWGPLRPESTLLKQFEGSESLRASRRVVREEEVCLEMPLPRTWDEYLHGLDGKQRHELRRKLRRLDEAGAVQFRRVDSPVETPEAVETFLRLFRLNRADKAAFMTNRMAAFFRALFLALAKEGMLRLFFLDVERQPVASVFCFDFQGTRYLYNSGYDEAYKGLNVGLMSKALSLREAIDEGLNTYNFLKGGEAYKYRLGGKEIPLWRCLATV